MTTNRTITDYDKLVGYEKAIETLFDCVKQSKKLKTEYQTMIDAIVQMAGTAIYDHWEETGEIAYHIAERHPGYIYEPLDIEIPAKYWNFIRPFKEADPAEYPALRALACDDCKPCEAESAGEHAEFLFYEFWDRLEEEIGWMIKRDKTDHPQAESFYRFCKEIATQLEMQGYGEL